MNSDAKIPLIALQPACNEAHGWVALLLDADRPLDNAALAQLLGEFALAEILTEIPCIVQADPLAIDPALAIDLPRERLILRFALAQAGDSARGPALAALRQAGFGLMTGDLPAGWQVGMITPAIKGDPTARSVLLKLLSLVTRDAESAEIEALVKRDASLAYKLLKLVNSVAFMPGRHIESFSQALVLLGRRQLQRWLMLLLFTRPSGSETASPLLPRAALRANLLEGMARRKGLTRDDCDHAFMTGMFSLLDTLFGQPLAEIIAPLHLSDEVTRALLAGSGPLGALLQAARCGEAGPTPELAAALAGLGLSHEAWGGALIEAARWAVTIGKEA
ncbi:MAG: EAL and HDOD domain-containing protein [Rhodocyclaceae bacterium]